MQRPAQFIGILAAALALAAVVLALPAWRRFGAVGLEGLGYVALASFLPGLILAAAAGQLTGKQRALQLLLLGTGLRIGVVLLAGILIVEWQPALKSTEFFLALGLMYLIALAVETRQLIACAALTRQQLSELAPRSPRQPQSH
jgi:hypothetical protein